MALTDDEIQKYRSQFNIPSTPPPTPMVNGQSANDRMNFFFGGNSGQQQPEQPSQPGFFQKAGQEIGNAFHSGIDQVKEGVQQVGQHSGNPLDLIEGVGKVGSGIVGAATSPLAPVTAPVLNNENVLGVAGKALTNNPNVQKFADSPAGQTTSRVAGDVANYANIAGAVGGGMEAPHAATVVSDAASEAAGKVSGAASDLSNKAKSIGKTSPEAQALKDVTPDYKTATTAQKLRLNEQPDVDGTPRVQEGGKIKGRTVTPNATEQAAAKELSQVEGYNPKMTSLQKQQLITREITARSKALETTLQNEPYSLPKGEIIATVSKAIHAVPDESLLLQKSDPVLKNYMRVVENAAEKANTGTLKDGLDVRKAMDKAYKNARGKMAFGSDSSAALDDVHTAGRDSLNKLLEDKATGADVKAELKAQSNLYRANDVISAKAAKEEGSGFGRLQQRHPTATKIGKTLLKVTGIGAAAGHALP